MAHRRSKRQQPTTTPQAYAYLRVSTVEQAQEGVSLDAQRAKIAAWCSAMSYELVGTFADEGISGYSEKRPGLAAAMNAVCANQGVLVVYSLSRLARNTKQTLELSERLAEAGANLASLSEQIDTTSASGKMVFRMLAVLSEFERDQISERTTMALAHKKSKGERIGEIPFGYGVAANGRMLVPDAAEQGILATVRQLRAQGLSLRKIVTQLASQGLTSRSGRPFQLTQVARMLQTA